MTIHLHRLAGPLIDQIGDRPHDPTSVGFCEDGRQAMIDLCLLGYLSRAEAQRVKRRILKDLNRHLNNQAR